MTPITARRRAEAQRNARFTFYGILRVGLSSALREMLQAAGARIVD
jgi:hypothetical protein